MSQTMHHRPDHRREEMLVDEEEEAPLISPDVEEQVDESVAEKPTHTESIDVSYLGVALLAHTLLGLAPNFGRYLQKDVHLTGMMITSLLALSSTVVVGAHVIPTYGFKVFKMKRSFVFITIFLRDVLSIVAAGLTSPVYVQCIMLTLPFMVALIGKVALQTPLPPNTLQAIVASGIGAILTIFGDKWSDLGESSLESSDYLGIMLAFFASCSAASYFVFLNTIDKTFSNAEVFWLGYFYSTVISIPLSLLSGDNWWIMLEMTRQDWAALLIQIFVVILSGSFLLVFAARKIGSPVAQTLLPWRMVVTVAVAINFFGQEVGNVSLMGAAIVIISLGVYLRSLVKS